jgi:hypothetical protein
MDASLDTEDERMIAAFLTNTGNGIMNPIIYQEHPAHPEHPVSVDPSSEDLQDPAQNIEQSSSSSSS